MLPRLFIAIVVVTATAACGQAPAAAPTATPIVPTETATPSRGGPTIVSNNPPPVESSLRQVAETVWQDTLSISMWMDRETLAPDETVLIKAQVENLTAELVDYGYYFDRIILHLTDQYDRRLMVAPIRVCEESRDCRTSATLEPFESLERELEWDGQYPYQMSSFPAPNGVYTIEARFHPGELPDQEGQVPGWVTLFHEVEVVGSTSLISPDEALQHAMDAPGVRRWLEAFAPERVTKKTDDGYYLRHPSRDGTWRPVEEQEYQLTLSEENRMSMFVMPDHVLVVFTSRVGYSAPQVRVHLDHQTGEVLRVEPNLDTWLNAGVLATFSVGDETFSVLVRSKDTIEELFQIYEGERADGVITGKVRVGQDQAFSNPQWSWRLDHLDIRVADSSPESCDGTPSMVEADLNYWIENVGTFCPADAKLVEIQDYR